MSHGCPAIVALRPQNIKKKLSHKVNPKYQFEHHLNRQGWQNKIPSQQLQLTEINYELLVRLFIVINLFLDFNQFCFNFMHGIINPLFVLKTMIINKNDNHDYRNRDYVHDVSARNTYRRYS